MDFVIYSIHTKFTYWLKVLCRFLMIVYISDDIIFKCCFFFSDLNLFLILIWFRESRTIWNNNSEEKLHFSYLSILIIKYELPTSCYICSFWGWGSYFKFIISSEMHQIPPDVLSISDTSFRFIKFFFNFFISHCVHNFL